MPRKSSKGSWWSSCGWPSVCSLPFSTTAGRKMLRVSACPPANWHFVLRPALSEVVLVRQPDTGLSGSLSNAGDNVEVKFCFCSLGLQPGEPQFHHPERPGPSHPPKSPSKSERDDSVTSLLLQRLGASLTKVTAFDRQGNWPGRDALSVLYCHKSTWALHNFFFFLSIFQSNSRDTWTQSTS